MDLKGKPEETFYLVRSDLLPEAIVKTIEAKQLLASGKTETVMEAVQRTGLSRSAFYKYKDGVFPFQAVVKEKIIVVSMNLVHKTGILSQVLRYIAETGCNVLTINQAIPLQGVANVTLTLDTSTLESRVSELIDGLNQMEGVSKANIVGRG
ncbi:MAG: ACT domain-containing protein [Thermicanus sp.]|nr:ACT domain-containing protein [Thermicanus sp.]